MRVVMLGDIVGPPGCNAVQQLGEMLRRRWAADLVLANAENAADGSGLTPELYERLCGAGLDGMTLGDHVYRRAKIVPTLEKRRNVIRPANLPKSAKGARWMRLEPGTGRGRPLYVATVLTRLYCNLPVDEPFAAVDSLLAELPERDPALLVEVHGEATSEKQALRWYLDGRAAAVLGSHTHVATADAQVSEAGTAFITDLGMTGPHASVLGRRADRVIAHMRTGMPSPFDVAEGDPRVCGVFLELDEASGEAQRIERIELRADRNASPFT